jgi:hypothetical protein
VNNDPPITKMTTTVDTKVELTVDGKSIGGTGARTTTMTCEGPSCPNINLNCAVTSKFSGTEVDDVQLQYGVK